MFKLYQYFGVVGLASMAFWIAAALTALNYMRHPRRCDYFLRALALAVAGVVAAYINSHYVGMIEADRTAELEQFAAQQKAQLDERISKTAQVRFAEDTIQDHLDLAGIKDQESMGIYERAAAVASGKSSPLYLKEGKQKRAAGSKRDDAPQGEFVVASGDSGENATAYKPYKVLLPDDLRSANRIDDFNRLMARLTLAVVLLLMLADYLQRFNRTIGRLLPVPMSGHLLDSIVLKTRAAVLVTPGAGDVRKFLERTVRKGETFIYFGPFPQSAITHISRIYLPLNAALERLKQLLIPISARRLASHVWIRKIMKIASTALGAAIIALRAACKKIGNLLLPCIPGKWRKVLLETGPLPVIKKCVTQLASGVVEAWRLPVLAYAADKKPFSNSFIFESLWFGRYGFLIEDPGESKEFARQLDGFMDMRFSPRAVAKRTVNVIWNHPDILPANLLKDIVALSHASNFKLIIYADAERVGALESVAEEICRHPDLPEHGPTLAQWLRFEFAKVFPKISAKVRVTPEQAEAKRQKKQARRDARKASAAPPAPTPPPAPQQTPAASANAAPAKKIIVPPTIPSHASPAPAPVAKPAAPAPVTQKPSSPTPAPAAKPAPPVSEPAPTPASTPAVKPVAPVPAPAPKPPAPAPTPAPAVKPSMPVPAPAPVPKPPVPAPAPTPAPAPKPPVSAPAPVAQRPSSPASAPTVKPVAPVSAQASASTPTPAVKTAAPAPAFKPSAPLPAPAVKPAVSVPMPAQAPSPKPAAPMSASAPKLVIPVPAPAPMPAPVVKPDAPVASTPTPAIKMRVSSVKPAFAMPPSTAASGLAATSPTAHDSSAVESAPVSPGIAEHTKPTPKFARLPAQAPDPVPDETVVEDESLPEQHQTEIVEINEQEQVFKFICPACGSKLGAQFNYQGIDIACPRCQSSITIPYLPS